MRRFGFDFYSASLVSFAGPRWSATAFSSLYALIFVFQNLIKASPLIALVTFGVPLACLSCLVYCICCSPFDALDDTECDSAAAGEARRARLLDRRVMETQLTSATYEDTTRARSIYSRFAGRLQVCRIMQNRRGGLFTLLCGALKLDGTLNPSSTQRQATLPMPHVCISGILLIKPSPFKVAGSGSAALKRVQNRVCRCPYLRRT